MLGENINSLISDIRQLNDVQLKQAAKAYERDALVLPLINRELTERVSMRQRMQAQQQGPQQQQPTIAQQVQQQAEQLPEDVGIGQLPAQNLQNMAGGGIVAFADGDLIEASGGDEDVAGGADNDKLGLSLDAARAQAQSANALLNSFGLKRRKQDPEGFAAAVEAQAQARLTLKDAQEAYEAALRSGQGDIYGPITKPLSAQNTVRMPAGPAPAAGLAAAAAAKGAQGAPGAPGAGAPPAAPAAPTAPKAPGAGGFGYSAEQALREANLFRTGLAAELQPLYDAERTRREGQTAALEAFIKENKPKDKAHEDYEKMLREQLGRSAQDREDAKSDAFVRAGAAMLASGSPFLGKTVGAGLSAGVESYAASKKEIRAQEKEIQKGLADIAAARRLEARGDFEAAAKRFETGQGRLDAVYGAQLEMQAALAAKTPEAAAALRREGVQGEFGLRQEAMRNAAYLAAAGLRGAGGAGSANKLDEKILTAAREMAMKENPKWMTMDDETKMKVLMGYYVGIQQMMGREGGGGSGGAKPRPGYEVKEVK